MIFNDYLIRMKTNQGFNQNLIVQPLVMCNWDKIIKNYLKTLVCTHANPFCDQCVYCMKINNDAYVDLVVLDAKNGNGISKDDINSLQQKFINQPVEDCNVKLYAIKNIENANKQVLNALLKFIEEPPAFTYGLFISNNTNQILGTILSRSNKITVNGLDDDSNNNHTNTLFLDEQQLKIEQEIYDFEMLEALAKSLVNTKQLDEKVAIAYKLSNLKKEEFIIFLKLLLPHLTISHRSTVIELINLHKLNLNQKNMINTIIWSLEKNND